MSGLGKIKQVLFGKPIASKHAHQEKLPKRVALPVFASDALSSTAYATEEIMHAWLKMGVVGGVSLGYAFLSQTFGVALLICGLIFIVAISYYQTIHAYPHGGGSYIVARDNLGTWPGRVAGASLLLDYVLTVAVSVSAGVLAIVSMAPAAQQFVVPLGIGFIMLLTLANLRGAKESGLLFSIPTYGFILTFFTLIIVGLFVPGTPEPEIIRQAKEALAQHPEKQASLTNFAYVFLALKAFSSGCTALTGIEAIANSTPAFKEPVSRNASITLMVMACVLSVLFIGASTLAEKFHVAPMELHEPGFKTVLAQITEGVFKTMPQIGQFYFPLMQIMTAAILILAANTAYADFPRLAGIISRDGYLPRQLNNQGDRLVYQNGIILLAIAAALLIIKFQGSTTALIPLYAIGVFLSFTLSQYGMLALLIKQKKKVYIKAISAIGGTITAIVTCVVLVTKFADGAWVVPIAMAALLATMVGIKRHYQYLAKALDVDAHDIVPQRKTSVLLLVPRLHKGILEAISYAQALAEDVRAVHVTLDPKSTSKIKEDWNRFGSDIPLVILESPFRSLVQPIIEYVDESLAENPKQIVTVIVPEAVPKHWYHKILHANVAIQLRLALGNRKNVVITSVRYFLQ